MYYSCIDSEMKKGRETRPFFVHEFLRRTFSPLNSKRYSG